MNKILSTQPNFRDMGGLTVPGGRRTRSKLIYRSGSLHRISEAEAGILGDLGIRHIVDLRSHRERDARPDVKIPSVTRESHLPIIDGIHEVVQESFEQANAALLKDILKSEYRRMVKEHREQFREFFRILRDDALLPLVFHCAMGKDRTGLAAYFFLHALGVEEEINTREYLLSNDYLAPYIDELVMRFTEPGKDGEILRPLLQVRKDYLDAGLDEIRRNFGGLDYYLENELGVDSENLRRKYLEDAGVPV